jgi:hypothetical protein
MNKAITLTKRETTEEARDFPPSLSQPEADFVPLAFRLELQSMSALATVLTTVAQLGARIAYVQAAELHATIALLAAPHVAHRVRGRLAQIIETIAVIETPWPRPNAEPGPYPFQTRRI